MTLSPSDVEQKTFSTALRGYDLDEVDDFLDEVVATIRELNEQIETGVPAPAAPVEPAPEPVPVPEPGADETAVGRALVAAQETADKIVADAREEAERILAEARTEADDLSSVKEQQRAEAEAEMAELTEHVAGVRSRLAVLATAVANRLDEMDEAIGSEPGELPEAGDGETETGVAGSHVADIEDDETIVDPDQPGDQSDNGDDDSHGWNHTGD